MFPRIPLVNGGIFGFVEMWGFSLFWLYWRETVQPVLCSVSRCPANCMRSIEKHFAVLRLLRIAKVFEVSTDFLLGGGEVNTPDRTNFDIEELGLSVQAARNLYTGKANAEIVNRLLESPRFAGATFPARTQQL